VRADDERTLGLCRVASTAATPSFVFGVAVD
jgi:hypothetical protein